MKATDKRLTCSDSKKAAIKAALLATAARRENQILRTYECKIVEKRLNKRQHIKNLICSSSRASGFTIMF